MKILIAFIGLTLFIFVVLAMIKPEIQRLNKIEREIFEDAMKKIDKSGSHKRNIL